jgi:hypothetical protein
LTKKSIDSDSHLSKKIFNEYEEGVGKIFYAEKVGVGAVPFFISFLLFLIFSALSGLVALSVAPLVPGDLVLAASQTSQPRNSAITAIWY